MDRRGFLKGLAGILAAGVAPAVLPSGIIMPVRRLITNAELDALKITADQIANCSITAEKIADMQMAVESLIYGEVWQTLARAPVPKDGVMHMSIIPSGARLVRARLIDGVNKFTGDLRVGIGVDRSRDGDDMTVLADNYIRIHT